MNVICEHSGLTRQCLAYCMVDSSRLCPERHLEGTPVHLSRQRRSLCLSANDEPELFGQDKTPTPEAMICDNLGEEGRAGRYVLTTAAHNEGAYISRMIESVVNQTLLPERWVIVSDASTDGTDEIVESYARKHPFIRCLRMARPAGRNFAAKVRALHSGMPLLEGVSFSFIGNVDADVSLESTYFEELLCQFALRPKLGIAGGFFFEEVDGEFRNRRANRSYSVTHAAQLVRRECFEAIGGYAALEYGGEDWHAEISAKMKGWEIEAFPNLKIFHHRHTGEGDNLVRYRFRQGRMDYAFGSDPLFEFLKCLERLRDTPFLIGGAARFLGFLWSSLSREERPVSSEFVDYLRQEQRQKILSALTNSKR